MSENDENKRSCAFSPFTSGEKYFLLNDNCFYFCELQEIIFFEVNYYYIFSNCLLNVFSCFAYQQVSQDCNTQISCV